MRAVSYKPAERRHVVDALFAYASDIAACEDHGVPEGLTKRESALALAATMSVPCYARDGSSIPWEEQIAEAASWVACGWPDEYEADAEALAACRPASRMMGDAFVPTPAQVEAIAAAAVTPPEVLAAAEADLAVERARMALSKEDREADSEIEFW